MNQQKNASSIDSTDDEIDLVELLAGLIRQRRWVIGSTLVFGSFSLVISLLMPPVFTATTSILPPQQQSSGMSAALGALAGVADGIAGLKSPNDLYVGMLESQTVADNLIKRFDLKRRYEQKTLVATRAILSGTVSIVAGKDGLITVSVDDEDPNFAASLANAYVIELKKLNQILAVTNVAQRRLFFEKQLERVKGDLAQAEVNLKEIQEKTGLLQPDSQIQAIIQSVASLKAQIAAKQVELSAMRSFATEQNPDLVRTQQQITAMQQQLQKLEQGQPAAGDMSIPTGKLPESGLAYIRVLRELKYQEVLFELMSKQYEIAKIDEARDSSLIQVLDVATVPDYKSKPKRALVVLLGVVVGLSLGVLIALIKEQCRKATLAGESRLYQLRRAWSGK